MPLLALIRASLEIKENNQPHTKNDSQNQIYFKKESMKHITFAWNGFPSRQNLDRSGKIYPYLGSISKSGCLQAVILRNKPMLNHFMISRKPGGQCGHLVTFYKTFPLFRPVFPIHNIERSCSVKKIVEIFITPCFGYPV